MLLVEYTLLDKLQVINETTEGGQSRLKLRGRFQKCDEQNNNGRIYPRKILESQVQKIQEKINDRSLVGALDHPANDAIHLSQASHLITGLSVDKSGDVIGECEILSTPNGKIVEALINDGVKIGISSRGVGSVSEGREGKIVNEDFKLITFDLVSDPSTKGAYPELTESIRENSQRAQAIVSKHKKQRVLMTMLESKINEALVRTDERSKAARLKRQIKKAGEEEEAKQDPSLEIKAANQPERRDRYEIAMEKGGLAGARRAATRMERNKHLESPKVAKAKRKIAKGTTGVPPGPGDRKSSRTALKASTNIFGKAMLEAFKKVCWGDRYDEASLRRKGETMAEYKRRLADERQGGAPGKSRPSGAGVNVEREIPGVPKGKLPKVKKVFNKKSKKTTQTDSIELFGDIIFETFAGLDPKLRTKRVTRVQKKRLRQARRDALGVDPDLQDDIANTFRKAGQHDLATQAAAGVFTRTGEPKRKLKASLKKRGARGKKDIKSYEDKKK